MRCPKCDNTIADDSVICPFCGYIIDMLDSPSDDELKEHIDLIDQLERTTVEEEDKKPTNSKKIDLSDVSLEETIAIDFEHANTLLDEINRQIDDISREAKEKPQRSHYVDIADYLKDEENEIERLKSLDSFKKRRRILVITSIASIILIAFMTGLLLITNNLSNKSRINMNFDFRLEHSISLYYETGEIDNLIYLMEDVKTDEDKLTIIQETAKATCSGWVLRYIDETAKGKEDFEKITNEYRELINGFYRYALVKKDDQYIRALKEPDYDEIMLQFEQVYTDSLTYYEALDLYNEKDYNKSYYLFSKIENTNRYYDKAVSYVDRIYENIIELINKDIAKMEKNIESKSDEDKLKIYLVIEETILEYNNVYTLELSSNEEYQKLLSVYTSRVSEYTELVYNK